MTRPTIGLFFGAGADIPYGLPSGGRFAVDIFRQDASNAKARFNSMLERVDPTSRYATDWLPEQYHRKPVYSFSRQQYRSLIESTLDYRRDDITNFFDSFDERAHQVLGRPEHADLEDDIETALNSLDGSGIGTRTYSQEFQLNQSLGASNALFGTNFFSALVTGVLEAPDEDAAKVRRALIATLQLFLGAHGHSLLEALNQGLFERAPDLGIFDELVSIFSLEFAEVGDRALDVVLKDEEAFERPSDPSVDPANVLAHLGFLMLEQLFVETLDYQMLIDEHFRYLFEPRANWPKFTRLSIFLWSVHDYMTSTTADLDDDTLEQAEGYYHDLCMAHGNQVEVGCVGTTNYNSLYERVRDLLGSAAPAAHQLNGSTRDFYDPYRNRIEQLNSNEVDGLSEIRVPFLLTQSGLKPMTSVTMSRRYVDLFDQMAECDAVAVVGYGFNSDDGHINTLFRDLCGQRDIPLFVFEYGMSLGSASRQRRRYLSKLRLSDNAPLTILPLDSERESRHGDWLDSIVAEIANV